MKGPAVKSLSGALSKAGGEVTATADALDVRGLTCEAVGELAAAQNLVLHELSPQTGSLEDAFLKVTAAAQEFRSGAAEVVQ